MLKKEYMESFESIFKEQYDTIHRLETNKLRNVAKMFAHLLYTDSLPWSVSRWGSVFLLPSWSPVILKCVLRIIEPYFSYVGNVL